MTDEKDGEKSETKPETSLEREEPAKEPPPPESENPNEASPVAGRSWVHPFARFDAFWTKWEARFAAGVLGAEIVALCTWISLKGMSAEYRPNDKADPESPVDVSGIIFRAVIGALVLGIAAHFVLRGKDATKRKTDIRYQAGVTIAAVLGLFASRLWASSGSAYFSNFLNWLQSASTLTLLGGLRGLATRLTLWLALLGASLATAQGKHINVDVVMRFLTPKMRLPVALVGWVAAAVVCFSAAWGFVDHLAFADFKIMMEVPCKDQPTKTCELTTGERMTKMRHEVARDLFLARRQIALDFTTLPAVVKGAKYTDALHATEWNTWLRAGDWSEYFSKEDIQGQTMDENDKQLTRLPLINIPGTGENTNGLLIRDVDFIFPFGLFMIALRFLLRCLLAIGGAVKVDPDAAHGDPDVAHAHEKSLDGGAA